MNIHDVRAEEALCAQVLLDPWRYDEAAAVVGASDFLSPYCAEAWSAFARLRSSNLALEPYAVATATRFGAGLVDEIQRWLRETGSQSVAYYARIVAAASVARQTLAAFADLKTQLLGDAGPEDVTALVGAAQARLAELMARGVGTEYKTVAELLPGTLDEIEQRAAGRAKGIQTGLRDLDEITGGLHDTETVIVAARPSLGKTALGIQVGMKAAEDGAAVLVSSLEQGSTQVVERMLSNRGRVDSEHLRTGNVDMEAWKSLQHAGQRLSKLDFTVADGSVRLADIQASWRRWAQTKQDKKKLAVLDYIGLVEGSGREVREQQVAEVSRAMKQLAKELHMPVIVIAQLNRKCEDEGREPRLSDLRESGSIEQDADVVLFIHREREQEEGCADLIIAKNRSGRVGRVRSQWLGRYLSFENLAYGYSGE